MAISAALCLHAHGVHDRALFRSSFLNPFGDPDEDLLYVNNDGGGFADRIEAIEPGTSVQALFEGRQRPDRPTT